MKKILMVPLFLLLALRCFAADDVKKADLAGSWYPGSESQLSAMLEGYMAQAVLSNIPEKIIAVISPHAGYLYSGPVAAYSFKAVSSMDVDTVVIIGFSHRKYFDAIAVYDRGSFQTPLGVLPVDKDLAKALVMSDKRFYVNPEAFSGENSIEMMLPFIRHVFKGKDIKIVPVVIGVQSYENAEILGTKLAGLLKDKKSLIVASTDMSHYHPYGEANTIDNVAIEALKTMDPKTFFDKVSLEKCEACGVGAVTAAMIAAKALGADSIDILKYANSGDTSGQKNSVVGYVSAAMYKAQVTGDRSQVTGNSEGESKMLNESQKKRLLQIARETMETYINTGKRSEFKETDPVLNRPMGAFVTLHENGQLRGCIGNIIGSGPLYLTVRDMAIESSTGDPRFQQVSGSELKNIDVEISVLSELKKVASPDEVIMGEHGVVIRSGFRSGVYLPQVATETGWSREEFLSSLCAHKAGLPPDAWKKGEADIYVFTAEVFGEKEVR